MLKDEVLKELAAHRDSSLSGQVLAAKFGVSRNAVWKAIKALESEGVEIEAVTNKGYRLAANAWTAYDIEVPEGVSLFFYESIDSTNTQAKRLLAEGLCSDALVAAKEQTAGRGRCGRDFYSPKNTGIYFSYVFHPGQSLSDTVFVTTAAAVAVVRAIERISTLKPAIKWVNDIFIGNKKVCGILSEAVSDFESGRVESVIIGIGINVSTKEFPKELADTATGLYESGITEANLLNAVIKELIPLVQQPCREEILQEYKAHSLVLEKEITFIENGVSKRAKAIDIDETGGLVVMSEEGIRTLRSGEISIRLK